MALVIAKASYDLPLQGVDIQHQPGGNNVQWQYSLLTKNYKRQIYVFEAPDAEAVQACFQQANIPFDSIWEASKMRPNYASFQRNENLLTVIEGTYPPITQEFWDAANVRSLDCYKNRNVEWLHTFMSSDRTRLVCELNAPDAEGIRETYRRLNIPFERVWSAHFLKS
ncbi:MAG: nickel-binding protein [Cyanobacteria bacterium P01_H01_bin.152]